MKNVNEHLISFYDMENSKSSVRELSLENCAGFTVMAQGPTANAEGLTFRLWAKMAAFNDTDLASLAAAGTTSSGLTTTFPSHDRWVLVREDVLSSDVVGEGNPGWAVTDQGFGYKAIKVTVSSAIPEYSVFVVVQASTLTNK